MTPQEDARVLLALVDRHLRALRLNLDPAYPDEEWGFTAQQAAEKLLKARIVLQEQLLLLRSDVVKEACRPDQS